MFGWVCPEGGVVCEGPLVGYESMCVCVCAKDVCIYPEQAVQAVDSHMLSVLACALLQ